MWTRKEFKRPVVLRYMSKNNNVHELQYGIAANVSDLGFEMDVIVHSADYRKRTYKKNVFVYLNIFLFSGNL